MVSQRDASHRERPAVARQRLRSLDMVTLIINSAVAVATSGDVRDQPKVVDAASKFATKPVYGAASLPLGTPVELDVVFEVRE